MNLSVGGPWRTHYQRHHIQENFMDVWTYGFYNSGAVMPTISSTEDIPFPYWMWKNLNSAGIHQKIDFGDDLPERRSDHRAQRESRFARHHPRRAPGARAQRLGRAADALAPVPVSWR